MKITLETERLILRPFVYEDAEPMFRNWASDPEVTKFLSWETHKDVEVTKAIIQSWIEREDKPERIHFAIVLKQGLELIGAIGVVGYLDGIPVIGYTSSRAHWGHGYMPEACKRVLELLKELGHKTVRIDAVKENERSNRVIQKCGGVYQKTEWEEFPAKGKTFAVNQYIVTL